MIFGPDSLGDFKETAKSFVMTSLVHKAELSDGVPPTMRAMYVLKTSEARNVLLGERSSFIDQEAALRGITPEKLAKDISDAADEMLQLELLRVKLNLAIDAATDESGVVAALAAANLTLPDKVVQV